ncbi:hypothetical protein [Sorangium sp. So ce1182]|uniref:hypothetical protein n=1 Tax=Sorangium sp. So ce1182 TaxID=3133334 RepID=UPI003F5ED0BB
MKKKSLATDTAQARGWLSVKTAAEFLDMSPDALRRALERHAVRAPDGGIEAEVDGVRARKFGRLWRVQFSSRWCSEATP